MIAPLNPKVIDLSHWNPEPDWPTLRERGTIGVLHKATEGTEYVDPTLYERARAALDAGLLWGTYHFMRPGNMVAQMDHYLRKVGPVAGERLVLDHEDPDVSLQDLCDAVLYLDAVRPDCPITIYSGHLLKEQLGDSKNETLFSLTDLWVAQYTDAPTPSWPWETYPEWTLWQYTDSNTTVQGFPPGTQIDSNHFNGDDEQLIAWLTPGYIPDERPEPGETVIVSIQTPPGVPLQIIVNGEIWTL